MKSCIQWKHGDQSSGRSRCPQERGAVEFAVSLEASTESPSQPRNVAPRLFANYPRRPPARQRRPEHRAQAASMGLVLSVLDSTLWYRLGC